MVNKPDHLLNRNPLTYLNSGYSGVNMKQIEIIGTDFRTTKNCRGELFVEVTDPDLSDKAIEQLIKIATPDRIMSSIGVEKIQEFAAVNEFDLVLSESNRIINGAVKVADSWASDL